MRLPSYQSVCAALGILGDSNEWSKVLSECVSYLTGPKSRILFATMLVFCEMANAVDLFDAFLDVWTEDVLYKCPDFPDDLLRPYALMQLNNELMVHGRRLSDFSFPEVAHDDIRKIENLLAEKVVNIFLSEETNYDYDMLKIYVDNCCGSGEGSFTPSQREVFRTVRCELLAKKQCLLFIDARGGTGKTYTLNAILSFARTIDRNVSPALAVATSGIAATQLEGGRTFHSRMRAPLQLSEVSVLDISVQSRLAQLIQRTTLIVWDEAPMAHRFLLEALDR